MGPPSPSWSSGGKRETHNDVKLEVFWLLLLFLYLSHSLKFLKTNVLSGKVHRVRITHTRLYLRTLDCRWGCHVYSRECVRWDFKVSYWCVGCDWRPTVGFGWWGTINAEKVRYWNRNRWVNWRGNLTSTIDEVIIRHRVHHHACGVFCSFGVLSIMVQPIMMCPIFCHKRTPNQTVGNLFICNS